MMVDNYTTILLLMDNTMDCNILIALYYYINIIING